MRVGHVLGRHVGEPFWASDLWHAAPAFPLAQQVACLPGKSSPGAREGRGVLLLDNVDEALAGCGHLPGSAGLWSTATAIAEGMNPPRLVILTGTQRAWASRVQSWEVSPLGRPTSPGPDRSAVASGAAPV